MILDVKKNIFFGILLSLITFLFIFIPGVSATQTVDGKFIYGDSYQYVSATDYDFSNFNFIYNNITYTKDYLYEIIENYLSDNNYTIDDFTYIFISTPKNVIISDNTMNSIQIELFSDEIAPASNVCFHFRGYDFEGEFIRSASSSSGSEYINASKFAHLKINLSDNSVSSMTVKYPEYLSFSSWAVRSMYSNKSYNIYSNYFSNTFLVSKQYDFKIYSTFYYDENLINFKPKSYTFNEDIDVTNISKVKVKFDLPSDIKNLNLSLNYSITGMNIFGTIGQPYVALKSINEDGKEQTDISNTDRVDYDTLVANACVIADCEQYKDWKTNPFEEMLDGITEDKVNNFLSSHVTDISKWDSFREITNKIINRQYNYANHYVDDFNMSLLPDSTVNGYSLEFDTFNYNGSLHLNFTSNLNYTIEYEYMSDNEDYFTTINMKDYAALIMIPKVYDRNNEIQSSISSDIYLSGKYDIELWESIESKNVLYRKSNYEDIVFSHYQHRLYPNAVLYFIKKPVDNSTMDLYIKFDSRYYSYVTKTNLAEEVVINNPNTGEDVTIGDISNLFDSNLENDDFSILDYLDDIRDTADYFDYYFNKGWKLLPFRIRAIILFIFNIMCVAIVLKIGGYKK